MNKKKIKNRKKLLLDVVSSKEYQPMRAKEIAMLLDIPKGKRHELFLILDELVSEGKLLCNKGKYEKVRKADKKKEKEKEAYLEGIYSANPKGFGFVDLEDGDSIYISEEDSLFAFHKDHVRVQIKPSQNGSRKEGRIIEIVEHEIKEVVGSFERNQNFGFVVPDNLRLQRDIFVPREHMKDAQDGDKVVAQILSYGSKGHSPEGKVTEILGKEGEPGIDVLSVARGYELPMEFPPKVVKQAEKTPDSLIPQDFQGRLDLRDWTIVTIDGEDAKDLDDGVSLTKEGNCYHLGVHIADVSNYVQDHSALDREAKKRGTSVYLVDRVIPMLPRRLSNGICSLNQGEDRLTLSCLMDIDEEGHVIRHQIAETVICVNRRMSYTQVKGILEGDKELRSEYQDLVPLFHHMKELSAIIRNNRRKRGAIEFDFPESKVLLDEMGKPVEIHAYEHNVATKIIEDFMVIANETVAKEFCLADIPFLYRSHEDPDSDRIENVLSFLRNQGVSVSKMGNRITPAEVSKVLDSMEGKKIQPLASRLLLRSMKQASYTTECIGHFGLAATFYCHFTSPIRRYPDLQIHRIIKECLRGRMDQNKKSYYENLLGEVAMKTSMLERRADEVERETIRMKKAEYMQQCIGQHFVGVVSGVTGWGMYVELENTVEGLIHVSTMRDDYYVFDEQEYCLRGEESGKMYRLGDAVEVIVTAADPGTRSVDFISARD